MRGDVGDMENEQKETVMGLGDLIESALSSVGLTHTRVEQWLGRPCGCEERQEKLNALTYWAARIAKGQLHKAHEYLSSILEGDS